MNNPIDLILHRLATSNSLLRSGPVICYPDRKRMGTGGLNGTLVIYPDRIVFEQTALCKGGGAAAEQRIPLDQVAAVRTGRFRRIYDAMAVYLNDGRMLIFCPALPASSEMLESAAILHKML